MAMDRRDLIKTGVLAGLVSVLPRAAYTSPVFAPQPGAWRRFQVVTRIDLAGPSGRAQAWVPLPSFDAPHWMRSEESVWTTNGEARRTRDAKYGAEMLHVEWATGKRDPFIEVTSRIATRDRAMDADRSASEAVLSEAERKLYLEGTDLIPTDGIVGQTAQKIVARKTTDLEKARAIYDWVVENSHRVASVRGCGIGDVAAMLATGNLGGKCADLNALFVGLARAAGLPARDIYGIRVAPSKFGYKSLGAGSEVITKAQHCRAEVFLAGHGWLAVDPADVRKVVLEEPPANLSLSDPKVQAVRRALFGGWEGNWLAYNVAHDIVLPGSQGAKLGFFMYPQAEIAGLRLDSLDPETFKYTIRATELPVA